MRLALADAADFVSKSAGSTAEGLRELDTDIEKGERNELGIKKSSEENPEDKDAKVQFEKVMDTAKFAGSKAIGAGQVVAATSEDLANRTNDRLSEAFYTVSITLTQLYCPSNANPRSRFVNVPRTTRITIQPFRPYSTFSRNGFTSLSIPLATSTLTPRSNLLSMIPPRTNT